MEPSPAATACQQASARRVDPQLALLATAYLAAVSLLVVSPDGRLISRIAQSCFYGIFAITAWRLADHIPARGAARRFWRYSAIGGTSLLVGSVAQSPDAAPATVYHVLTVAGVAGVVWPMLTQPLDLPGRQRLRLWLDSLTVMCGAAVLTWSVTRASENRANHGDSAIIVAASALLVVSAYAMMRLIISRQAPFSGITAVAGGTSAILLALCAAAYDQLLPVSNDPRVLAARLLAAFLLATTPRIEQLSRRQRSSPTTTAPHSRPSASPLPYIAVVTTQGVLLLQLLRDGISVMALGTVVGMALITLIVTLRQRVAVVDNERLVARLDDNMAQLDASMQRLLARESWFRSLVQNASDIAIVIDADGRVTYASPALTAIMGYTPGEATGHHVWNALHAADAGDIERQLRTLIEHHDDGLQTRIRVQHADGSTRWLDMTASNLLSDPAVSGVVVNIRDVTESHRLQEQLQYQATHDVLTGLANRAQLDSHARRRTDGATTSETRDAVLLLDLDGFKAVNDLMGHHVGDQLLMAVADRLRASVRPIDVVARFGGDEFVVVLAAMPARDATVTAERILQQLALPVTIDGQDVCVRASLGIAIGPRHQLDTLLLQADQAMYTAKRSKSGVVVYSHSAETSTKT